MAKKKKLPEKPEQRRALFIFIAATVFFIISVAYFIKVEMG